MILRKKLVLVVVGVCVFALNFGLGISTGLFIQKKQAVQLREYEEFLQDEGGDKNGVPLEYQEDEQRKLLALQKAVLGDGTQEVADTLAGLTEIVFAEKNLPEAESLARESIAAYKTTPDPAQFKSNGILVTLSRILWQENKMAEAEAAAREAIARLKEMGSRDDPGRARVNAGLRLLAGILWDEGKAAEAQAVYDEAFKISPEYLTQQIQALKTQSDEEKRASVANQPPRSPVQGSEQYFFQQTNIIQRIPGWGGEIDPEGGCAAKVDHGTLTVFIPEATHPIGQLVASEVIDGTSTNSVYYTGRRVQILQAVTGDFSVETEVSWKWDQKIKPVSVDDAYFFRAGLCLTDGTNTIDFYSSVVWRSVDWSAERQAFEDPIVDLDYNLFSYHSVCPALYKFPFDDSKVDYSMGFAGKFSHLRMSRIGGMIHLAISRDAISWLETRTLPLPASESIMVGLEASHNSHNAATVEFSEFKLSHAARSEEAHPRSQ
jgi:regulation of enolase protein 1 (concanavalin A-like superfamily)